MLHLQNQFGLGAGMTDTSKVHDIQDELRRIQTENVSHYQSSDKLALAVDFVALYI